MNKALPKRMNTSETPSSAAADGDDSPGEQPSITVTDDGSFSDDPLLRWLGEMLDRVAVQLALRSVELSVVVVGDDTMAQVHERYSGVTGTTDVLTFDYLDQTAVGTRADAPGARDRIEGEVYICRDEAERQSADQRHTAREELLLYAVHGLLHLLGYDDHDTAHHAEMHAREDALLEAIGIGRVFDTEGGS